MRNDRCPRRPRCALIIAAPAGAVLAVLLSLLDPAAAAALDLVGPPAHGCRWRSPVDAPIVDPFRPPAHPFAGGGNRGIEFGTAGSEPVAAVDAGRVTFAGPVGGEYWLVVTHRGGLRSTYGPLESVSAVRGQSVEAGDELATAAAGLHLTARLADRYLDPGPLLAGRCGRARLVPAPSSSSPARSSSEVRSPSPARSSSAPRSLSPARVAGAASRYTGELPS